MAAPPLSPEAPCHPKASRHGRRRAVGEIPDARYGDRRGGAGRRRQGYASALRSRDSDPRLRSSGATGHCSRTSSSGPMSVRQRAMPPFANRSANPIRFGFATANNSARSSPNWYGRTSVGRTPRPESRPGQGRRSRPAIARVLPKRRRANFSVPLSRAFSPIQSAK